MITQGPHLVSVIIPSYNQARYLAEAIESALKQTYAPFEIIVVDDGSIDNSTAVASSYPGVRCIRQQNQGIAGARNTGLRESEGNYLVFLDHDDRLLPNALEIGLNSLDAHPECAFVWGQCQNIASDGAPLPTKPKPCIVREHYLELLRNNYIRMPGVAMYRRSVFDSVGGFNPFVSGADDYDLHLRITRDFPVHCHNEVVIEYRLHGANTSRNTIKMFKVTLAALHLQRDHVKKNHNYKEAYESGIKGWKEQYGHTLVNEMLSYLHWSGGEWKQALRLTLVLLRYCPELFMRHVWFAARKIYRTAAR